MILDRKFYIQKTLGQGGSSKVFLGLDSENHKYAIKILRKDKGYSYEHGASMIMKEHMLLQNLKEHPNILQSYQASCEGVIEKEGETEKEIMYNILEFAEHGSLSFFIRTTGHLEEEIARFQFNQMANAAQFIHSQEYAHLDMKLENILLDKYFNAKVADLGAAVNVAKTNGRTYHRRGTILYMAQEVLDLKSGETFDAFKADIYSLGVCLYVMLVGEFPSLNNSINCAATNDSVKDGSDDMDVDHSDSISQKRWELISKDAKDLILQMISLDPKHRPTISEVMEHKWVQKSFDSYLPKLVYLEMEARKDFIISSYQKSKTSSH
jgi:serine/threonine protein kinase